MSRLAPSILVAFGVLAIVGFFAGPVILAALGSLLPGAGLAGGGASLSKIAAGGVSLEAWRGLFSSRDFLLALRGSFIVAALAMALSLALGAPCAYALARLPVRGRGMMLTAALALGLLPQIAVVPSLYLILQELSLIDTYVGVALTHTMLSLPLTIWLLHSFLKDLPRELEEAAAVDGASRAKTMLVVVLPLAAPGLGTAALLAFIASWNELLFSMSFTLTPEHRTLPVALTLFRGQHEVPWSRILAGAVTATAPVAVVAALFQRWIVRGLTAGAIKG